MKGKLLEQLTKYFAFMDEPEVCLYFFFLCL